MPLLESLIGLTLRGGRREPVERRSANRVGDQGMYSPHFDGSLTAGAEDTWTPSGAAAPRGADLVLGRQTSALRPAADGARRECGNVFCRSAWTPPWKSREYPIIEGRWACSPGCAEALVRSALARETGGWPEDDVPEPHRHRIPLGLVLLAHGWITHAKLQRALDAQRANGFGRIGEWLISESGVSAEDVTRGLGAQWNCPVLTVDGFSPQTTALALPRVLIEEYGALPLRVVGGKVLYVGFQDQLDAASSFAIEQMSGLKTESGVMAEASFLRAKERLLGSRFPRQLIAEEADRDTLAQSVVETIERTRPTASRLLKLHRYYWLRVWSNGGECRPGSTLPMSVDAVSDYLFTIARHPAATLPQGITERQSNTRRAEGRMGGRLDTLPDIFPDTLPDFEIAAVAKPDLVMTEPIEIDEPLVASGTEPSVEFDITTNADLCVKKNPWSAQKRSGGRADGPVGKLRVHEAALALIDRNAVEIPESEGPVLTRRSVWDGLISSQRSAERPEQVDTAGELEIETIEGEYLPLESAPDELLPNESASQRLTGFLFLHRRSDWKHFQAWSQKNLSFLRRAVNPASGPDQEG